MHSWAISPFKFFWLDIHYWFVTRYSINHILCWIGIIWDRNSLLWCNLRRLKWSETHETRSDNKISIAWVLNAFLCWSRFKQKRKGSIAPNPLTSKSYKLKMADSTLSLLIRKMSKWRLGIGTAAETSDKSWLSHKTSLAKRVVKFSAVWIGVCIIFHSKSTCGLIWSWDTNNSRAKNINEFVFRTCKSWKSKFNNQFFMQLERCASFVWENNGIF